MQNHIQDEKKVIKASNIIPIKQVKTFNIFFENSDAIFKLLNEEYLLICGLNKNSIFGILFTIYLKLIPSSQFKKKIVLTTPQYAHSLLIKSHQIIYAKYFSFTPYKIKNISLSQQINYIGQRWFARFANCFILIYKKI